MEENTITPSPHDPNTFHSHQLQSVNDSDNHGMVEQTIITETRRTTEATMRMEHKNQPDIPLTLTQNTQTQNVPVVSEGTMFESTLKTSATNTDQLATSTDATQTPPQTLPKPADVVTVDDDAPIDTSSISKHTSLEFFSQKILAESMPPNSDEKYTKFEDLKKPIMHIPVGMAQANDAIKLQAELAELNLLPGTPPEMGFMPKWQEPHREPLAEKVKRLEESNKMFADAPSGGVRTLPPQPKVQIQQQTTKTTSDVRQTLPNKEQLPQLNQEQLYTPMSSILSSQATASQDIYTSTVPNSQQTSQPFQPQPIQMTQTFQDELYTLMAPIISKSPVVAQEPTAPQPNFPLQEYQEHPYIGLSPIMRPQANITDTNSVQNGIRAPSPRPSAEGIIMEKLWASPKPHEHEKEFDLSVYHTSKNEFAEEKIVRKFSSFSESDTDYKYESASETDTRSLQRRNSTKETARMFENKIKDLENSPRHDYDLKAPGLVKQILPRPQQERQKSVLKESPLPDIYLEPGSPPEMCYAPRTVLHERKQSLVETIEQTIEKENEKGPSKVLAGAVRMIPPPLKKEEKHVESAVFPNTLPNPTENGTFPFFLSSEQKSFETTIVQTNTINNNESKAPNKWQPGNGSNNDIAYRSVNAPQAQPLPQVSGNPPAMNGHIIKPAEPIKPKMRMVSGYMADTEDVYQQNSVNKEHFESHSINHTKRIFESFSNNQQTSLHQSDVQCPTQQHSLASVVNQQYPQPTTNPIHKHYRHYNHKHDTQKDETSGNFEKVRFVAFFIFMCVFVVNY